MHTRNTNARFHALTAVRSRRGLVGLLTAFGLTGWRGGVATAFCSKPGGKCVINADCCGPGAKCKNLADIGECTCRANRVACAGICCPPGQACCGRCADLLTDPNNCGACFTICDDGEHCVGGACTA
jgi:hypothetical protein